MKFWNSFISNKEDNYYHYRLILDIGTEYLKAAVVEYNKDVQSIIGLSRIKQDYGNMDGGAVTNISGVVEKSREAIFKLKEYTPHQAAEVVCGVAGEFVKGVLLSLERIRERPNKMIDRKELFQVIKEGERKAYGKAVKMAELETGFRDIKLELIKYSVVEIKVDGYKVINPYKFQGKNLNIIIFYTFIPLVQVGALHTIAREIGCQLVAVVPEPLAVAETIRNEDLFEFGAIVIDIGGGTTDIALIRNGGIEGTRMFAMGGRAFTRSLAANLNISIKKAEVLKLDYSMGRKVEKYDLVDKLIKADLNILYQGIELSLFELAQGELLPKSLYFCGGGSGMKGLISGFKKLNLNKRLPFGQKPVMELLKGVDIECISDENSLLQGVEFTTPRALAYYGAKCVFDERRMINLESQRL